MSFSSSTPRLLGIYSQAPHDYSIESLCETLDLPLLECPPEHFDDDAFIVLVNQSGLSLAFTGRSSANPILIDFTTGSAAHRRLYGGGKGQLIVKAVGIKNSFRPQIMDLTAGLGQDAFVLATQGCQVDMVERSPIVHALLNDALMRARASSEDTVLIDIISRMSLALGHSLQHLSELSDAPDVIYLDPMYPEREKSALVKKTMQAFHGLLGTDDDAGPLLSLALAKARYRVVVKRPRKAPTMNEQYAITDAPQPSLVLEGKSSRYDIYPLQKMPLR